MLKVVRQHTPKPEAHLPTSAPPDLDEHSEAVRHVPSSPFVVVQACCLKVTTLKMEMNRGSRFRVLFPEVIVAKELRVKSATSTAAPWPVFAIFEKATLRFSGSQGTRRA